MESKQTETTRAEPVPTKQKDPRLDRIRALEREIEEWRYHNSQSNPGAVMELRSMRKELEALKKQ
jgi:hypothetical protein